MIDDIDATREKGAFTPVQYLAADSQFGWHGAEIKLGRQIQVKHSEIAADQVLPLLAQRRAQRALVFVPLVIKGESTDEKSEIIVVRFNLGS